MDVSKSDLTHALKIIETRCSLMTNEVFAKIMAWISAFITKLVDMFKGLTEFFSVEE